jgi:3-oxoadipate enol-lactonase
MPEGRLVELPGRGITFVREAAGPANAPTLLLLHGWTANSAVNWFATYAPLAEHFNVIAMDHRGHGQGLRTWRPFQLEDCADDAVALLDELGLDQVIPVGYSMGGPVAQLIWRSHRERVAGLVLCATASKFREHRAEGLLTAAMAAVSGTLRVTPDATLDRLFDRFISPRYDDTALGRWALEQQKLNDFHTIVEAGHAVASFDSRDWVHQIGLPTSIVTTTDDTTVQPERQALLSDSIADAEVFTVVGGHDVCATIGGGDLQGGPAICVAKRDVSTCFHQS